MKNFIKACLWVLLIPIWILIVPILVLIATVIITIAGIGFIIFIIKVFYDLEENDEFY